MADLSISRVKFVVKDHFMAENGVFWKNAESSQKTARFAQISQQPIKTKLPNFTHIARAKISGSWTSKKTVALIVFKLWSSKTKIFNEKRGSSSGSFLVNFYISMIPVFEVQDPAIVPIYNI